MFVLFVLICFILNWKIDWSIILSYTVMARLTQWNQGKNFYRNNMREVFLHIIIHLIINMLKEYNTKQSEWYFSHTECHLFATQECNAQYFIDKWSYLFEFFSLGVSLASFSQASHLSTSGHSNSPVSGMFGDY